MTSTYRPASDFPSGDFTLAGALDRADYFTRIDPTNISADDGATVIHVVLTWNPVMACAHHQDLYLTVGGTYVTDESLADSYRDSAPTVARVVARFYREGETCQEANDRLVSG